MTDTIQGLALLHLLVGAVVVAWIVLVFGYIAFDWYIMSTLRRILADFDATHPGECYLCTTYRGVMGRTPPVHRCDDWRHKS